MTESSRTIDSLPPEMIESIRRDAEHFPSFVRHRGREYFAGGRVGPLEVEDGLVRATVRGTRRYRTAWRWDGSAVDPLCTCPVGPLCKHAYALALAAVAARAEQPSNGGDRERAERFAHPGRAYRAAPGDRDRAQSARRAQGDADLEALRQADPWSRGYLFGRVVASGYGRGVYLSAHEFRSILEDPDPDLMCWRLAQEIPKRAGGWLPRALEPYRDRPDLEARAAERGRSEMAEGLARWARSHATTPTRSVRVVLGLMRDERGAPRVTLEARVTTPRLRDEPRTAQQLVQLGNELRRSPTLLAPPHARLLRSLAGGFLPSAQYADDRLFELMTSSVNRLLDSFADSPLATWGEGIDPDLRQRAGLVPGARLQLGDEPLDILPACVNDASGMRIRLAASWPDGRQRALEEVVFLAADDDLHPSLVLAAGTFWRVGEEPPRDLLQRFAATGSLPVPETGRERFLEILGASFASVAEALAPHTRLHPAHPVVTLDLGDDDWLRLRLFAHTGDPGWRPGTPPGAAALFEFTPEGRWARRSDLKADEGEGAGLGALDAAHPGEPDAADSGTLGASPPGHAADPEQTAQEPASAPAPGGDPSDVRSQRGDFAASPDIWLEAPDPARVEPPREWLLSLASAPADPRASGSGGPQGEDAVAGWWLKLSARNLERLADAWDQRPAAVTWLGNRRTRELLGGTRTLRPRIRVEASGVDWFAISAEWEAEGLRLTEADLAKLRGARTRFVKLPSGWVRRELAEQFDADAMLLADLGVEIGAGEQRVTMWQLAQARPESLAALQTFGAGEQAAEELERLRLRVREFEGLPRVPLPSGLRATLRPYQRDGLDFLVFVTGLGRGAVLADDMGLGKTVQALAWLQHLKERPGGLGPCLVVCPASVVHNWVRESERFTPGLRVLTLTSGDERHELRREIPSHDLVVTNYALLRRDLEQWRRVPLAAAILDEAQNVKNPDAAVSRAVLQLDAPLRLALTGTPLENRALDLWSIMQFVNPGYLGSRTGFVARYDRPDAPPAARTLLAARLRPVLLRRLKRQVASDLPDRIEERRDCQLTAGQRLLYVAELTRSRALVNRLGGSGGGVGRNKIEILAALTRLRQVCCHPALAGGKETLGSGKFDALFELLEPLLAEGHKVLVFSQFVECLKLLARDMTRRDVRHHMLTGATTKREAVVDAFEGDPDPCVFLISLKAGGTGLNLTAASYVVLFDPWWNPAVEAQAIDRTHRIGQTRTVIAYRMLAEGTIEERIWELQQRKAALVRDVIGEDGFARTLTRGDLDYLLHDGEPQE